MARPLPFARIASCAAALAASGGLALAAEAPPPDLSAYRWQARVLVIDTPSATAEPYRAQAAALLAEWSGLRERDIHIITRAEAGAFRFRLFGKDGLLKLDRVEPVTAEELFAVIDAMPMRRAEAARRTEAPATGPAP